MSFKSNLFRALVLVCLLLTLTFSVLADTVRLKDGSIIKGRIVGFENGKFTVVIDDGTRQRRMDFSAEEVQSIIFDSTPTASTGISNDGNTRIITVGQAMPRDTNTATSSPPKVINNSGSGTSSPATPDRAAPPITINIRVLADDTANGWTNSGWVVRKGQRIKIISTGRISLGNGRRTDAGGISTLPDPAKLIADKPTGSLIAVVGADNNEFIYLGESREFTATRDGDLFLGVNEGNLSDNTGAFDVVIEVYPI